MFIKYYCPINFKGSYRKYVMLIFCRFRTAINVLGDSIGAGLVYHLSKKELEEADTGRALHVTEGGFEAVPMAEIEDGEDRNNGK